ncbi:MAG: AbiH family protein [Brevinemataceae bacterium]
MGKTVILIGNGYDVALGYKTSYKDFVESKYFDEIRSSSLCQRILKTTKIQNWIDLELEILEYAKELSSNFNHLYVPILKKEYNELCDKLTDYLKFGANISSSSDSIIKALQNIWWKEFGNNNSDKPIIICFNYTHHCNNGFSNWCDVKYVHGTINLNKIVLGVDEISYKSIHPELSFILKSGADDLNVSGISDIILNADKFIIFGCSLGESDHWYYDKIFKNKKGKHYEVYYYKDDEKEKIINRIRLYAGNLSDFKSNNVLNLFDSSDLAKSRLRYNMATKNRLQMGIPSAQKF